MPRVSSKTTHNTNSCKQRVFLLWVSMAEKEAKRIRTADSFDDEGAVMEKLNEVTKKLDEFTEKFDRLFGDVSEVQKTVSEIRDKVNRHDVILEGLEKKVVTNAREIESINEKVTKTNQSVEEVKKSVDNWKDKLEASVVEVKGVAAEVRRIDERMMALESRVIDQEARSRRNNLLFFGVAEKEGENCTKVINDIINKLNVGCRKNPTQRAHRLGPEKRRNDVGRGRDQPRPIIVNFLDFQDRQAVRFARKHLTAPINVGEDFPLEVRNARKSLQPELRELWNRGKRATIAYPARLIVDGNMVKEVSITGHPTRRPR